MNLVEIRPPKNNKFEILPTDTKLEVKETDILVAKMAQQESVALDRRLELMTMKFLNWCLSNPEELNRLLLELEATGVLLPFEYGVEE